MTEDGAAIGLVQAIVLGIVQGLSEFLPISSTAHLRVVPSLFGWADPGAAYSAVIQLGSVIAVICYFFQELLSIAKGTFTALAKRDYSSPDFKLAAGIILGTLPICVLGLLLKPLLEMEHGPFRSLPLIGGASIFMGLLLLLAEKLTKRSRTFEQVTFTDCIAVGFGQALALVPGCSRSGSTLTVAMFLNLNRHDAARFSFLLGIPAIVLSGLLELKEMVSAGLSDVALVSLGVGLVSSTVVSYAAIWWLLRFLQSHSTLIFVGYRLVFGAVVLYLSLSGSIH